MREAGSRRRRSRGRPPLHAGIHQTLGDGGGGARVGLVVLGHQLEADLLAAEGHPFALASSSASWAPNCSSLPTWEMGPVRASKTDLHHHVGERRVLATIVTPATASIVTERFTCSSSTKGVHARMG